jgi:UDP-glucose 4-epimerase
MNVLITGGCGFIGSHLAEFHLNQRDQVRIVDNLSTGTLENIASFNKNPDFQFFQADILTWPGLVNAIEWSDRIYHFAAIVGMFKAISEPLSIVSTNIIGCNHLFHVIATTKFRPLVIIPSSSSVYGDNPNHLLKETDNLRVKSLPHPLATYAISKLSNESIALAYYQSAQIPVIIARLFNTIGPRQTGRYGMVVPRFVHQALQHEPFTIYGDGIQTRSFCDVRDIVSALILLAKLPTAVGEIINVGNDIEISINELADLICQCVGYSVPAHFIPYEQAYGVEFTDITQRRPDLTKLLQLTSFKHQWTLERTINNLLSQDNCPQS